MSGTGSGKTNGMAVAGFVLALIPCTWLLGLIFSAIAVNQTGKDKSQGGRGLAIAGLVISLVWAVIVVIYWSSVAALIGLSADSAM